MSELWKNIAQSAKVAADVMPTKEGANIDEQK